MDQHQFRMVIILLLFCGLPTGHSKRKQEVDEDMDMDMSVEMEMEMRELQSGHRFYQPRGRDRNNNNGPGRNPTPAPHSHSDDVEDADDDVIMTPKCGKNPEAFDRGCCMDAQRDLDDELHQLITEGYEVRKESYLHWNSKRNRCLEHVLPFWERFSSLPNCRDLTTLADCCGYGVGCRWSRIYKKCRTAAYLHDTTKFGTRYTKRESCK